jgi:hypothetical protein
MALFFVFFVLLVTYFVFRSRQCIRRIGDVKDCYNDIIIEHKQDDYFNGDPYTRVLLKSSVQLNKGADINNMNIRKYTYIFKYKPSELKPDQHIMFSASASRPLYLHHNRKYGYMEMIFNEYFPRTFSMLIGPQIPSLKLETITASTLPNEVTWRESELGTLVRSKHAYVITDVKEEEDY